MSNSIENPGGSLPGRGLGVKEYMKEYSAMGDHVKRYKFIRKFVKNKFVIEIGCGNGAGSMLMNDLYSTYLGLDVDEEAIDYATRNFYQTGHREFQLISSFERERVHADVVVCFEVLEHVYEPQEFLDFIFKIVREDGLVILSTPNGLLSHGKLTEYRSKHHVEEYTPSQIYNMISPYGKVKMFGEKRIDNADLKKYSSSLVEDSHSGRNSHRRLYNRLLSFGFRFLNGSLFWTIKPTRVSTESHKFSSSTIFLIIKRKRVADG